MPLDKSIEPAESCSSFSSTGLCSPAAISSSPFVAVRGRALPRRLPSVVHVLLAVGHYWHRGGRPCSSGQDVCTADCWYLVAPCVSRQVASLYIGVCMILCLSNWCRPQIGSPLLGWPASALDQPPRSWQGRGAAAHCLLVTLPVPLELCPTLAATMPGEDGNEREGEKGILVTFTKQSMEKSFNCEEV